MQAMNQVSGINVTSYYMSYVFINALGISKILSRILAACGSVDYLIFACLAYFGPGIIVSKNKLATQLSRPQTYIDQDERIAQETDGKEWNQDVEKDQKSVNVEPPDEKKELR